jgi:hypothetical protein
MHPYALGKSRVFRGEIIDFDTRRPLEGTVVVAMWFNTIGDPDIVKDVKEALANKRREWSIVVEEGSGYRFHPLPRLIPLMSDLVVRYIRNPGFMIFKPIYKDFQRVTGRSYSFLVIFMRIKNEDWKRLFCQIVKKKRNLFDAFSRRALLKVADLRCVPYSDERRRAEITRFGDSRLP